MAAEAEAAPPEGETSTKCRHRKTTRKTTRPRGKVIAREGKSATMSPLARVSLTQSRSHVANVPVSSADSCRGAGGRLKSSAGARVRGPANAMRTREKIVVLVLG